LAIAGFLELLLGFFDCQTSKLHLLLIAISFKLNQTNFLRLIKPKAQPKNYQRQLKISLEVPYRNFGADGERIYQFF
jgi:hypothetical protein